jgi:D-methionine transport system substrate-binding protein
MRTRFALSAVAAATAIALSACGGGSSDAALSDSDKPLKVGASPVPHAEILNYVADELAEKEGLKIDVVEFTDYVQPNVALKDGSLDANYFQTIPYLE